MKPIHVRRLKKLIAFLRKLPRERFNFGYEYEKEPSQKCPTVACAMGWAPVVFPELTNWTHSIGSFTWGKQELSYGRLAEKLFGIPAEKAGSLFFPGDQKHVDKRLPECSYDATPKQVAAMLEKFIKLQTAKK